MLCGSLRRYFSFVASRRSLYLTFNKQLLIGETAGFAAGVIAAEAVASVTQDEFSISVYSSISDYAASILGFLAIYYRDNRALYQDTKLLERIKKVIRGVLGLWVSILSADIAFLIVRPYFHYVMLQSGLEPGIGGGIAHFMAFAVFNCVAIFSRSLTDYVRQSK